MALLTEDYTIGAVGTPVPGYPIWPPAQWEAPGLERIVLATKDDTISFPQPGGVNASAPGVVPVFNGDSAEPNRVWTARGNLVERVSDPLVMKGLPRLKFNRTTSTDGFAAVLDAALTSYTLVTLFTATDFAANNALFCVGVTGATRLFLYIDTSGKIVHHHGTGDPHTSTLTLTPGVRYSLVVSFDAVTKELRIYINTVASPFLAATKTANPPADKDVTFGVAANGTNPLLGEMVPYVITNKALHLDAAKLGEVMAGLNQIRLM